MRIVLTHIPRTGGTSILTALQAQLPKAKTIELSSLSQVALMTDANLNGYDIISTYLGSNFLDRLVGDWIKLIIFRDPISRLKSSYSNLRNSPDHALLASPPAKHLNFREYLASRDKKIVAHAANVQAWTALGDKSIYFREQFAHLSDQEVCKHALARLSAYHCVGFTEDLEGFWKRTCQQFGWPVTDLPHIKKSQSTPDIEEASPEDLDFYTRIDSEFLRQIRLRAR